MVTPALWLTVGLVVGTAALSSSPATPIDPVQQRAEQLSSEATRVDDVNVRLGLFAKRSEGFPTEADGVANELREITRRFDAFLKRAQAASQDNPDTSIRSEFVSGSIQANNAAGQIERKFDSLKADFDRKLAQLHKDVADASAACRSLQRAGDEPRLAVATAKV